MALTSEQKHYIKKNMNRISLAKMASDLKLPEHKVRDYLKKRLSREKYEKLIFSPQKASILSSEKAGDFNFKNFITENANIIVFLFLLVFVVYFNSINNDFTSDDVSTIKNNANISNVSYVFSSFTNFLQRVIQFSIYHTAGINPAYFRIIDIIFHFISVILIFAIVSQLHRRSTAIFASALFAVHPILVESVTWLSGMPYAFYTMLFLISFLLYINSENKPKFYYLSIFLFFVTLNTNEKAMSLFLIFILYEFCFGKLKDNWKRALPYFGLSLIWVGIYGLRITNRVQSIGALSYTNDVASTYYNPLSQIPTAISSYLKLMFWPQALTLYHTDMNFSNFQFTLIILAFLAFLAIIFLAYKKNRRLFFWLLLFPISLMPTLTPLKISWVVAERYVYLGTIGVLVAVAILFDWLLQKEEKYKNIIYTAFAIIVVALSARTIMRNIDWKNEDNLWVATAKVDQSGPNVHNNLGDVYARHHNFEKAAEEFKMAIKINPAYGDAYHNLGNTYHALGQLDLAIENYQKALSLNPNIWQSYQNLASIYYQMGDYKKAEEDINKAIEVNPNNPGLQDNKKIIEQALNK